jgi:hypothetical protein
LVHVVHTYDGNTESLYLDGVLQSTAVTSRGAYSNWYTGHKLTIGNEASGDRPYAGHIKMVAIYNRALDSAEIQQNYAAGPSGQGVSGSGGSSGSGSTTPDPTPDPGTDTATSTGGSVKLSWKTPTTRTTGDTLSLEDIDRYEIFATPQSGGSSFVFVVENASTQTYTLSGLAQGTYEVNVITIDKSGLNSSPSNTVTVSVNAT